MPQTHLQSIQFCNADEAKRCFRWMALNIRLNSRETGAILQSLYRIRKLVNPSNFWGLCRFRLVWADFLWKGSCSKRCSGISLCSPIFDQWHHFDYFLSRGQWHSCRKTSPLSNICSWKTEGIASKSTLQSCLGADASWIMSQTTKLRQGLSRWTPKAICRKWLD